MINPILVITAVVFAIFIVIASIYFLVYYQHPDDKLIAWFPKFVVVPNLSYIINSKGCWFICFCIQYLSTSLGRCDIKRWILLGRVNHFRHCQYRILFDHHCICTRICTFCYFLVWRVRCGWFWRPRRETVPLLTKIIKIQPTRFTNRLYTQMVNPNWSFCCFCYWIVMVLDWIRWYPSDALHFSIPKGGINHTRVLCGPNIFRPFR
jgi:hypothetical protein